MYSIRWGTKSAAATLYIREPVGGTHISCWKLIFNIFPRSITLEQKLDSCLFTEVCASVCARVCVRLFCPCCLNVTWCFVGISCELGCSPNQYPAAYGLSACPTHTHTHPLTNICFFLKLAAATTPHSWSHVFHRWPKHQPWLGDVFFKVSMEMFHNCSPTWNWHHSGNTLTGVKICSKTCPICTGPHQQSRCADKLSLLKNL